MLVVDEVVEGKLSMEERFLILPKLTLSIKESMINYVAAFNGASVDSWYARVFLGLFLKIHRLSALAELSDGMDKAYEYTWIGQPGDLKTISRKSIGTTTDYYTQVLGIFVQKSREI